jgi:hypothetical protein
MGASGHYVPRLSMLSMRTVLSHAHLNWERGQPQPPDFPIGLLFFHANANAYEVCSSCSSAEVS